ncbi:MULTISPECIES: hypothetical protein [Kitasatospora]|uniref:hypothetical protein n=1 Tax=Kitasatospora TaxID=2063 RepID=UPI000CC35168|nr:hypothetical protein [Kitasatospora sp. GP30]MDH6141497.1 hypothetical protein [Kitasatospora sp. GP30]
MSAFLGELSPILWAVGIGSFLGLITRQLARRGKRFSKAQIRDFAKDLRHELYMRSTGPGQRVDLTDYLQGQPYFGSQWLMEVYSILYREKIVFGLTPLTVGGRVTFRLTDKGIEEARMERLMSAAENPRTVNNYQAGVVQIGDHNSAENVTANFGTDQSRLLAQLVAALVAVAGDTALQPQLRGVAEQAAADLETATRQDPSRVPVILERIRGIVSVAATGFETVRPILEAIGSAL